MSTPLFPVRASEISHFQYRLCNWYILLRQEIKKASTNVLVPTGWLAGGVHILIGITVRITNKQPHDFYQLYFPTRKYHHLSTSFQFWQCNKINFRCLRCCCCFCHRKTPFTSYEKYIVVKNDPCLLNLTGIYCKIKDNVCQLLVGSSSFFLNGKDHHQIFHFILCVCFFNVATA